MNRKIFLASLFIILFVSATNPADDWKIYQFQEGKFKVMFPAKPETKTGESVTSIKASSEGVFYTVSFSKKTEERDMALADTLLQTSVDEFINGMKTAMETTVESSNDIKMLNYPAKEVKMRAVSGAKTVTILYRVLVTPKQLYQFHIIRDREYVDYERASKFFNSFELLENQSTESWKTYQFKYGKFKILLPARPEQSEGSVQTRSAGVAYRISYSNNEGKGYDMGVYDKLIKEAADTFVKGLEKKMKITVESSSDTKMLGLAAKELRIKALSGGQTVGIVYRVLLTKEMLYQFDIIRTSDYVAYENAGRFFNSFELMKK